MLEQWGISYQSELVYRELLTRPELGVGQLAQVLKLSEGEVRQCLDELVAKALARESRDNPENMRAVRPEIALHGLLRSQELEVAQRLKDLAQSKASLADVVAAYTSLKPNYSGETSERLVGLDAIQARLEHLARDLSRECLSVMPGGAQSQASLDASRLLDLGALRNGVTMLTLYQDSARNDAPTSAYARWLVDNGGQVRTSPTLPPRMVIFDRSVAIIPIDPMNTRMGALCTVEPAVVAWLVAAFEQAWEHSTELSVSAKNSDEGGLSSFEKELLRLLGTGMTDEAAGGRLGISPRTVRRQMAALMDRLGATSRFEAGLKAAQRGWL